MKNPFGSLSAFLGVPSLNATGRDAYLIIALRCARMFSAGIPSVILALFFSSMKFPDSRIGLFMTLTLFGDVILSLLLTLVADRLGRRNILLFGSIMMVFSGSAFAVSENYWILLVSAVVGVISVTGGDCGPFRAVEESVLSGLTDQKTRSDVLAWYVMATNMAAAMGTEVAGRVVHALEASGADEKRAYHLLFWGYAGFGGLSILLALGLSGRCEAKEEKFKVKSDAEEEEVLLEAMSPRDDDEHPPSPQQPIQSEKPLQKKPSYFSQISRPTRSIMYKLWILLAVDSIADGMTPYSLMNYYVSLKFHVAKTTLGDITSASLFLCAVSSIFAAPLSRRIGLINTMVFTHLPSSIASAFIPMPRKLGWTIAILLFRAALNSMDQAPRTAFIAAVVKSEERTAVMGITSMGRTLAASLGPTATGILAGNDRFWIAFLCAGIFRVSYDLGLFTLFVNVKLHQHEEKKEDWSDEDERAARKLSDEESLSSLAEQSDEDDK